jgi:glutathione synthase/RimK-type ligase-like ATP-grasp enzyme
MVHVMKLWAFNDPHNWGSQLAIAAAARGHDVHLFDEPRQPDQGYVFMHMHHHPQVRMLHKRCMEILSLNPDLVLIPDYRSSVLYDNKLEQARQFARWMPRTTVFYTPGAARRWLALNPDLPFVSKSSEGSSSHNVRVITTYEEAKIEIKHAFSDIGIKCRNQQTQRGYLMWQTYVPGSDETYRVVAIGRQRLIVRAQEVSDVSSRSTRLGPVVELDEMSSGALDAADRFLAAENLQWAGVDLIRGENGVWYVIEITVRWTLNNFYEASFFRDGQPTGNKGDKTWDTLIDELEAGTFSSSQS